MTEFMLVLEQDFLHIDREDKWLWKDLQTNIYTVKSAYTLLENTVTGKNSKSFSLLWILKALSSA